MGDTAPAQALKHAELVAGMTPEQRLEALRAVDRGIRRLVMARLRAAHPGASERELVARYVAQVHGAEVARRLYGALPADVE